jgi:hypothetical protein
MNSRLILLILVLALVAGIALGLYTATSLHTANAVPTAQALRLTADDQNDYILIIADAYAADGDLKLAQDRLGRLRDPQIATRVEEFAINYAPKRNLTSIHLIHLAMALGSRNTGLIAVVVTTTPTATHTLTPQNVPVFSNVRATRSVPTKALPTPTPADTQVPVYVVVPNEHPFIVLPTDTPLPTKIPTITPTRRPSTRVPTPTETPLPTDVPPPPPVIWEPGYPGGWPPGVYFAAANVQPGEKYWHLVKAVYCDFIEENFGCLDRPGNTAGTSIYVIDDGEPLDVIRPDGRNVGNDPTQIGDPKEPSDMCECSWTWLVSDYRISVAGAPSDAIGGFALYTVGGHVLEGHAHVRYFLYFENITR